MNRSSILASLLFPWGALAGCAELGIGGDDIEAELAAIPGVTAVEEQFVEGDTLDRQFLLEFEQPADHDDPGGQTFQQRLFLLHRSPGAPMVLASTGYYLWLGESEPTAILGANQLTVEHRFFEPSRPLPADWRQLRIKQAAADHHRIVEAFKPLYPARWLSTGGSKGGMASVYHRRFYPDDVDGTIAYVAPQSYGDSDPRYIDFLEKVGDAECRDKLRAFQQEVLSRRPRMTAPMIAEDGEAAYSHNGLDGSLDYAVLFLQFAFWQRHDASLCASVPEDSASDDEVWAFLNEVSAPAGWRDEALLKFEPYYFQAAVELGYPAIDDSHLAGLLTLPPGSNIAAALVTAGLTKEMMLDAGAMPDIADWLSREGERMLFVYGENDPYSAAAFELGDAKDSYRFFVPGGNHGSTISDLPDTDKAQALQALSLWGLATPRPPPPAVIAQERAARRWPGR